jgi:hypothetical protein
MFARAWHSGCAAGFQPADTGSTPVARSSCSLPPRDEDVGLRTRLGQFESAREHHVARAWPKGLGIGTPFRTCEFESRCSLQICAREADRLGARLQNVLWRVRFPRRAPECWARSDSGSTSGLHPESGGSIPFASTNCFSARRGIAGAGLRSRLSEVRVFPGRPCSTAGGATGCARGFYPRGCWFESSPVDHSV